MVGELLLDTGALVGLLDGSQTVYKACADFYLTWEGAVATTEAVLTEAIHLLSGVRGGGPACIDFILRGGVVLVPFQHWFAPTMPRTSTKVFRSTDGFC